MVNPKILLFLVLICQACTQTRAPEAPFAAPVEDAGVQKLRHPGEIHLRNVRQLSFGAENAEAYWSFDSKQLIFQTNRSPFACDQIMRMPVDGSVDPVLVSTGLGKTTCSYFMPGDNHIVYATTQFAGEQCPSPPDRSQGYVWPLDDYEIVRARANGSEVVRLTNSPGYDAEATVCGLDGSIVFTSIRDGDLDLYRMDRDGNNVRRLTQTLGYDGGAFFSADCKQIVWRASRPKGAQRDRYKRLLAQNLFRPSVLEVFVANADGSNVRQVTDLKRSSFAPFFFPSGKRIIFASDYQNRRGREFDLWAIDVAGTNLERITFSPGFDGFPMFSPHGKKLAFSSNRNQSKPGETDIYVADWVEKPVKAQERAEDRYWQNVRWLAADKREGRGLTGNGLVEAERWLARRFRSMGVEPGSDGGYRQSFEVVAKMVTKPGTRLVIDGGPVATKHFVPVSTSSSTAVEAATVFVGHGIIAKRHGVHAYRHKKVKGKIAVAHRFVVEQRKFPSPETARRYDDLRHKAFIARERGAIGLILIDRSHPDGQEAPPELEADTYGDAGIPIMTVSHEVGKVLIRGKHRVAMTVELEKQKKVVSNVIGVIRAGKPLSPAQAVIVGAHYDHLGYGEKDSRSIHGSAIHNGADDNASGVAALLEVAQMLKQEQPTLRRDVYFIGFAAEELGVLGSAHFVQSPPAGLSLDKVSAMINMDMVGRMRGSRLDVHGGTSAVEWSNIVDSECDVASFTCEVGGSGYGPSDHMPFYAAGIPVLHFSTGSHVDYHRPTDDIDRINATGGIRIAKFVKGVVHKVANRDHPLTYRKVTSVPTQRSRRTTTASLGTIPSYRTTGAVGMLLDDVVPGGAAAAAGLRRGDRIVKLGNSEIRTVHDLMYVLERSRPGQRTTVTFVRNGKQIRRRITYQSRKRHR